MTTQATPPTPDTPPTDQENPADEMLKASFRAFMDRDKTKEPVTREEALRVAGIIQHMLKSSGAEMVICGVAYSHAVGFQIITGERSMLMGGITNMVKGPLEQLYPGCKIKIRQGGRELDLTSKFSEIYSRTPKGLHG